MHIAAGAVAGISGALWIHTHRGVIPGDVGLGTAVVVVLAVAIGGARFLPAAGLGVALVLVVGAVVAATAPGHAPLLLALILGAAVWALPDGVAGLPARLRRRRQPPARADETAAGPDAAAAASARRFGRQSASSDRPRP
ncbi:hypothetical protein [Micromonospora sp. WMMD1082]|uniref:hypothetical protein n=1 Tax=Micromonospora sp. WMMD1082 TaxID=3016104 RepID=UPI0024167FD2|nr:hypothetical protein [Micromonospora sp. WMMD1082]MDG4798374.1 hypothetical protein [Micromonospora sp. WMMD1082]